MKKLKIFYPWIFVGIWMVVIFCFSAQNADNSKALSNGVLGFLLNYFGKIIPAFIEIDKYVRKFAHVFEYFVLGFLVANAMWTQVRMRFWQSILFSAMYALSDEIHQIFVPGRACRFIDLLIDVVGAFVGILLYRIIRGIYKKLSRKTQAEVSLDC